MNSSLNSRRPDSVPEPLLVREAGVAYAPAPRPDPIVAWNELMEVVEALCPRWPQRAPPLRSGRFVLLPCYI